MKKIIYIDMKDVLSRDTEQYNQIKEQNKLLMFPQSEAGFYINLRPMRHCKIIMHKLITSKMYNPYIISSESSKNPHSLSEKYTWIKLNMGHEWNNRFIICSNKSLLNGDIFITHKNNPDDSFNGQIIKFGSDYHPDWKSIEEKFFNI